MDAIGTMSTSSSAPQPRRLFYSVAEVAVILAVPERTVRHWAQKGGLDVIRVGSTIRIPATFVDDLLRTLRQ